MNPPKRDFIGKQGPPGYVAGIGRGATGFTTRSDIGPAREAAAMAAAAAMASTSSGATSGDGGPARKILKRSDEDDEDQYLNDSNYDEFAGYGGSLFNKDPYEDDDEEADKTWEAIDKRMNERGKKQREAKTRQELDKYREERPKIQEQFSDLKADLKRVSEQEWLSIPDVGDARNRKQRVARQDKFTPVPDSILAHQARIATGGERLLYLDPKAADEDPDAMDTDETVAAGHENSALAKAARGELSLEPDATTGLNIGEMSEFRGSYMSMKLMSRVADSEGQLPATNPQDYLTNLEAQGPNKVIDEAAANEYRQQFAKLRDDNPSFPNAWIVSVRLEEAAGKLKAARSLILKACEKCPKSADIWCEAARLYPPEAARALMVKALREIPRSVKLWCRAAELETDDIGRRKVYAKAREIAPKSVLLWKKSAELEQPDEARLILRDAVECCPEAVELWLALARLEPYERAVETLIRAAEKNPTEKSVWITLAKLEEAAGRKGKVADIIKRSLELILKTQKMGIKRDDWFKEAMDAEKANFKTTCYEIIKQTIGLEDEAAAIDRKPAPQAVIVLMDRSKKTTTTDNDYDKLLKSRLDDAQKLVLSGAVECARAVYETMVESASRYARLETVWLSYADFERKQGSPDLLEAVLRRAVKADHCIRSESLWLMLAHERRAHLNETRQILSDALDAKPDSERIVMAAVELECDNGNHKVARRILADACMSAKTPRLVMKAAKLEWELGNLDEAQRMLKSAIEEYKAEGVFYLSMGQIEEQRDRLDQAKQYYNSGLKFCPTCVELWIAAAKLEEKTGSIPRARAKLQNAILRNPKVPLLQQELTQLEARAKKAVKLKPPHADKGK